MIFPNKKTLYGTIAQAYEDGKANGKYSNAAELAEDLGYPAHMLRKVLDYDDSASLPASKLKSFMDLTGSYEPLKYLARRCGFVLVKIPKSKTKLKRDIPRLGQLHDQTLADLYAFWAGRIDREELLRTLDEHLSELFGHREGSKLRDKAEQSTLTLDDEEDEL